MVKYKVKIKSPLQPPLLSHNPPPPPPPALAVQALKYFYSYNMQFVSCSDTM